MQSSGVSECVCNGDAAGVKRAAWRRPDDWYPPAPPTPSQHYVSTCCSLCQHCAPTIGCAFNCTSAQCLPNGRAECVCAHMSCLGGKANPLMYREGWLHRGAFREGGLHTYSEAQTNGRVLTSNWLPPPAAWDPTNPLVGPHPSCFYFDSTVETHS